MPIGLRRHLTSWAGDRGRYHADDPAPPPPKRFREVYCARGDAHAEQSTIERDADARPDLRGVYNIPREHRPPTSPTSRRRISEPRAGASDVLRPAALESGWPRARPSPPSPLFAETPATSGSSPSLVVEGARPGIARDDARTANCHPRRPPTRRRGDSYRRVFRSFSSGGARRGRVQPARPSALEGVAGMGARTAWCSRRTGTPTGFSSTRRRTRRDGARDGRDGA